ncbi:hypothetical protein CTA2_517 [Colletotrichum tanaceti]|nr:hypothetical protein CTA2_517 [Colletotrichum tanaceti]
MPWWPASACEPKLAKTPPRLATPPRSHQQNVQRRTGRRGPYECNGKPALLRDRRHEAHGPSSGRRDRPGKRLERQHPRRDKHLEQHGERLPAPGATRSTCTSTAPEDAFENPGSAPTSSEDCDWTTCAVVWLGNRWSVEEVEQLHQDPDGSCNQVVTEECISGLSQQLLGSGLRPLERRSAPGAPAQWLHRTIDTEKEIITYRVQQPYSTLKTT